MLRFALLALALAACSAAPAVAPDAAQDVAPELGADTAPPDASPAADADAAPDLPAPDAPPPDVVTPPDAVSDTGPDVRTDAGPEAAADAPRDVGSDLADAAADADPLLEQVTAERVTVIAPGYEWLMARTQMCTVTGGVVSVGADYDAPERVSFTFLGPSTLTYISGGRGYSDVRAELRTGAPYLTDGESVRRVNVQARGQIPGGLALTLTALGCVVR